jgi:hypothetical protein
LARIAGQHVALTDGSTLAMAYDLETLETRGPLVWNDRLQHQDCAGNPIEDWFHRGTTAHCHLASADGAIINYFTQPGAPARATAYNFYRIPHGTRQRKPIGVVTTDQAAYVHAFSVTQRRIVFPENPLRSDPSSTVRPLSSVPPQDAPLVRSWRVPRQHRFPRSLKTEPQCTGGYCHQEPNAQSSSLCRRHFNPRSVILKVSLDQAAGFKRARLGTGTILVSCGSPNLSQTSRKASASPSIS